MSVTPLARRLAAIAALLIGAAGSARATVYVQTNLVSDIAGLALVTDPSLKNPWGVAASSTGPFWVSDQGTNLSTLYSVAGTTGAAKAALTVSIPTTAAGPQGPTGQVFNSGANFAVTGGNGAAARFIFANLNGTISAWNSGTAAIIQATTPGAVYTGLAINAAQTRIYAANDAGAGSVNVFNSAFAPVSLPGAFVDPTLPAGLVPYNVEDIGGKIYVAYAPAGRANQTSAVAGSGVVAVFDENGVFQQELIRGGQLASPWGMALAPASFGALGGDLLVANFSFADSVINAYNPATGAFAGSIAVNNGGNAPGGLWALTFGNGGSGGDPNTLYVSDGINSEQDGLFAAFTVPEPAGLLLLPLGLIAVLAWRRMAPV